MDITAKRLRELREQKQMSQGEVAKILGISRPAYVLYETGRSKPVRKIKELCNLFGVTSDYILGTDVQQVPINLHMFGDDSEEYSQREKNLIKKYRTLSDAAKDFIDMTVDASYQRVQNEKKSKRSNA